MILKFNNSRTQRQFSFEILYHLSQHQKLQRKREMYHMYLVTVHDYYMFYKHFFKSYLHTVFFLHFFLYTFLKNK